MIVRCFFVARHQLLRISLFRNPIGYAELYQNSGLLKQRVDIICEELDFDRNRVIGWAFSQAILSGIWSIEDGESSSWAIEIAMAFKKNFATELDFYKGCPY